MNSEQGQANTYRVRFVDDLPIIETDRMFLIIAMADHVGHIVRYLLRNRDHLQPWEPVRDHFYFTEAAWIGAPERDQNEARCKEAYRFRLVLKPSSIANSTALKEIGHSVAAGEYIGTISLRDIQPWPGSHATLGYSLDHAYQGHGLMIEGVQSVVRFGFENLNLRRIEACFMPGNRRSARLLDALGFQVEGLLRSSMEVNGAWEDHHICSLINHQWRRN